jgi:hypothetical protein
MYTAIEAKVPIVAVAVSGKGYDFAEAVALLKHLDTALDAVNPGACELLRSEGVDPVDAAFKLSVVLPSIISVPFNSSASAKIIQASVADIADTISGAVPMPITKSKEQWLKQRTGNAPVFKSIQHGDTAKPAELAAADKPASVTVLAVVPVTVPELPEIMSERTEIVAEMSSCLLGADRSSGKVSLSSVKKSKLATHGQGGVGKTTMAAVVVRDAAVRGAFDAIGWVSVGQQPSIPEMQRMLYHQLVGEHMAVKDGATAASQLADLQAACIGKRWLVVLDDVWDKGHEQALNCVDPDSASKLLVTTRIRGLIAGCEEVSLNLLSLGESVDLLLRTAQVKDADQAAKAAALEIAELCGNLPLYLCICGGVILGYNGQPDWQTELVAMLKDDRVGVIHDGSVIRDGGGDRTVELLLDTSLSMVDEKATLAFIALGICPEDSLVKLPVARLICGADADVVANGKVSTLSVSGWIQELLDRNLLIGSISGGVQLHDIVRDLLRTRIGEAGIRAKQRSTVGAFAAICPANGWSADDAVGQYAALALVLHMKEALLADPLSDTEAHAWLDVSNDVLTHPFVCCAGNALGHACLLELAKRCEAESKFWEAARRISSASATEECQAMLLEDIATGGGGITGNDEPSLLMRVCDLLVRGDQTEDTRTLELSARGRLGLRLPWTHPFAVASGPRILELAAAGVKVSSPAVYVSIGMGKMLAHFPDVGVTGDEVAAACFGPGATRHAMQRMIAGTWFAPEFLAAANLVPGDNPYSMVIACGRLKAGTVGSVMSCKEGRAKQEEFAPHSLLAWVVENYDHAVHHPMIVSSPIGVNDFMCQAHASRALAVYGDVALVRKWLLKAIDIYESADVRADPSLWGCCYFGAGNMSNSFTMKAGLGDLVLRFMKAQHLTFAEVGDTAEIFYGVTKFFGFKGEKHCYSTPDCLAAQIKRRHWLLAPGEVGKGAIEAWLKTAPAEFGSSGQSKLIDCLPCTVGYMCACDCADVFESLERYEEGITAAQVDIRNYAFYPQVIVQSQTAIGRCQARLGRLEDAAAAFEAAITEARECELPFLELLARRDYIVHVLDAEGRREEQMAPLGDAISRMVMAPGEYTAILGCGIDAEAAVAAFEANSNEAR